MNLIKLAGEVKRAKEEQKKVQITFLKIVIGHWPWQKIALGVPFQLNQFGDVRTQSQQE